MRFHNLIFLILNNNYFDNNTTFFNNNDIEHHSRRIRALAYRLNTKFFNRIKENVQKRKVIKSRFDFEDELEKFVKNN